MSACRRAFALLATAVALAVAARADEPADSPPAPPAAASAPAPTPAAPPAATPTETPAAPTAAPVTAPNTTSAPAAAPGAPPAATVLAPEPRIDFELRFPAEKGGGKAVGTAATIEYQRDDFATASGNVDIKYQDYDIKGDAVSVDLAKKVVTALGHVIIDQGPRRMTGEKATFDLETKTGVIENAHAYLEPDYYFSGSTIRKTGDDTYEVEKGIFTSCKGDSPAWSFKLSKADLRVEGYAHLKNVAMRVKKVPMLYLPYLVWPVKRDRASGFLVPNIGYTNRRGGYLGISYYQVLGRSVDTTFLVDGYEKGYYGVGDELRYQPTAGTKGLFRGYAVHDPETNSVRWKVQLDQETTDLPWGLRAVINYRDYSDFNFFRDFERDLHQSTLRTLYSQGFVTGNWGPQSLNLILDDRQTFIDQNTTVRQQKIPSAEYRIRALRLFGAPLYLDLVSSASYLSLDRGGEIHGKYSRVDAAPSISAPLSTIPWFSLSVNGGGHGTFYGDSVAPNGSFTGETVTRILPTAGLQAVGPSFSRIFDTGGSKIKHVVEPRWQYSYLGSFDDAAQVPLFDDTDTQFATNVGRFTLVNRFLVRPNAPAPAATPVTPAAATPAGTTPPPPAATAVTPDLGAREVLAIEISEAYSFDKKQALDALTDGTKSQYSPMTALVRYTPSLKTNLRAQVTYSTLAKGLQSTQLTGSYGWTRGTMGLTWFTRYDAERNDKTQDQIGINGGMYLWPGRLRLDAQVNYDLKQSNLQNDRFMLTYNSQCWGIHVEYRDFQATGFQQHDWRFSISLKNIGQVLDFGIGDTVNSQ